MGKEKIRIYKQDCDASEAQDKSLPYTSFIVEYIQGETSHYDIVIAGKKVDIFDHYYDMYKQDFVTFNQTEGRANPKLWNDPTAPPKETKK